MQGFRKRFLDIHNRYDSLLEKIMRDREELRKNKKPNDDDVKDFLDIMLDIFEDEHSEVQLTRNHIKALILVSLIFLLFNFFFFIIFLGCCYGD